MELKDVMSLKLWILILQFLNLLLNKFEEYCSESMTEVTFLKMTTLCPKGSHKSNIVVCKTNYYFYFKNSGKYQSLNFSFARLIVSCSIKDHYMLYALLFNSKQI